MWEKFGYDILISFLGAFLGFGLTLLVECIVSIFTKRNSMNKSLIGLVEELEDIKDRLDNTKSCVNELNEDDIITDAIKPISIEIPIWEAFIQTGNILLFMNKNKNLYKALDKVYNHIRQLSVLGVSEELSKIDVAKLRKNCQNIADEIGGIFEDEMMKKIYLKMKKSKTKNKETK